MRRAPGPVDLVRRTARHARELLPLLWRTPVADTLVWDGPASKTEFLRSYARRHGGRGHRNFTVVEIATGRAVGALSIRPGSQPARGDIGYWIGVPHQGKGLGTAAVARALEIAFGPLKMEKVEACAFVGNRASRRILEKNGFRQEGLTRKAVLKRGRWLDEWVLGITREDWEAATGTAPSRR